MNELKDSAQSKNIIKRITVMNQWGEALTCGEGSVGFNGPVLSIFLCRSIRFQDAWYPFILVLFLPFAQGYPAKRGTVISIAANHLFSFVRGMGAHGSKCLHPDYHWGYF